MSEAKQHWAFCLILVFVPLLLFVPPIVSNQIPYFMDIVTQFFPIKAYAAGVLHQGELPLYNPTYYCGVPLVANPQWGMLYPGNLLLLLFPSGSIFTLTLVLHQIIGSLGVYLLVRRLTGDAIGALAGGVVFSFSGYVWAHYAFGAFLFAIAWVPFVFWSLEEWIAKGKIYYVLLAGCFVGLQILSGAPQIALYALMSYAVVSVSRAAVILFETKSWREALRPMAFLGGAVGIGIGLSAPQWLSTLGFLRQCERAGGLTLPEIKVGTLTLADLWRSFTGGTGFPEDAETTAYIGVGTMFLLFFSLFRKPKARVIPYIVLILLACVYSLRAVASLFYQVVPGYSHFHDPKRVLGIATVVVATLCGIAILHLRRAEARERMREAARLIGAIVAVVLLGKITSDGAWKQWNPALPASLGWIEAPKLFIVWNGWAMLDVALGLVALAALFFARARKVLIPVVIALIFVNLTLFAFLRLDLKCISAEDIFSSENATVKILQGKGDVRYFTRDSSMHYSYDYTRPRFGEWLLPNVGTFYGLADFQGYDPIKTRRYAAYLAVLNEGYGMRFPRHFGIVTNERSPLLRRANVGYEIADEETKGGRALRIRGIENSFPRLQSVSRFVEARSFEEAVLRLRNEVQYRNDVIVVESKEDLGSIQDQLSQGKIKEAKFGASRVRARIENEQGASWLVLRTGYARGWKAYIDGKRARVYPVDVLFMGVLAPKGNHTVTFAYVPADLLIGVLVMLGTMLAMAAAYFFSPIGKISGAKLGKKE